MQTFLSILLFVQQTSMHMQVEDITTMGRREAKTPTKMLKQHMGDLTLRPSSAAHLHSVPDAFRTSTPTSSCGDSLVEARVR
jgi:hypothetical protein